MFLITSNFQKYCDLILEMDFGIDYRGRYKNFMNYFKFPSLGTNDCQNGHLKKNDRVFILKTRKIIAFINIILLLTTSCSV